MKSFFSLILLLITVVANGQPYDSRFRILAVNQKVKEFSDTFDLSSPLSSFITLKYILMNGKDGLQWKICSANKKSLLPDSTAPDSQVPENIRQQHLNTIIREIVWYKDSIAFVISQLFQENAESYYSVRNFHPEHGKWIVNGEDLFQDIERVNNYIRDFAEYFYKDFEIIQNN